MQFQLAEATFLIGNRRMRTKNWRLYKKFNVPYYMYLYCALSEIIVRLPTLSMPIFFDTHTQSEEMGHAICLLEAS